MLLLGFMLACQNKALEEENTLLKRRVEDLERAGARLEQDNETLKAQLQRVKDEQASSAKAETLAKLGLNGTLTAIFRTNKGDIHCTLRASQAPETVANFVGLAEGTRAWTDPKTDQPRKQPLYDGTIFHRVIPGFMIQGGDPLGNGTGGPGYTFADEVGSFTVFDKPGLLAMANSGPDTNGSQFFITEGTPTHLNGKHTIFGDCSDLDVVKAISAVPRNDQDRPQQDVVLKKVEIQRQP